MAPLLNGHPALDELLVVRLRQWRQVSRQGLGELGGFVSELRRFAADVALDLMGDHKAAGISRLSSARTRIGFSRSHRREPSSAVFINRPVVPRGIHAADRLLSPLDALALPPEPADFGPEKRFREEPSTVELDRPFALLHPGA